jgi:hypothetical protein
MGYSPVRTLVHLLFLFAHPVLLLFGQRFADEGASPLRVLLAGQVVNLAFGPIGTL